MYDYCDRDGVIPRPDGACEEQELIFPRWSRLRDDPEGNWTLESGFTCPGDGDYPFTYEDFIALPITPSTLTVQPNTGWVYAGLETIAYTDDSPQGFLVSLMDIEFAVAAAPLEYEWDFGDGSPIVITDDPGAPWPDHSVSHMYATAGNVTPTLMTRWEGYVRRADSTSWSAISGVASTTTTGPAITVHTARTRLVEDSLD